MNHKPTKEMFKNLITVERPDVIIHKVYKFWKSRYGFYWVRAKYSVRGNFNAFNTKEDEIFTGEFPYPLEEFYKLSSKDQLATGISFNKDEPIGYDYLKRKLWYYYCKYLNKFFNKFFNKNDES